MNSDAMVAGLPLGLAKMITNEHQSSSSPRRCSSNLSASGRVFVALRTHAGAYRLGSLML